MAKIWQRNGKEMAIEDGRENRKENGLSRAFEKDHLLGLTAGDARVWI